MSGSFHLRTCNRPCRNDALHISRVNSYAFLLVYYLDRLPSGREVEIFYLEDLHLQQVPSSKASRARAQLQQKQEQQHAVERSGSAGSKTSASAPGQPPAQPSGQQKPGQAGGGRGEAGQKKKFSSKRK